MPNEKLLQMAQYLFPRWSSRASFETAKEFQFSLPGLPITCSAHVPQSDRKESEQQMNYLDDPVKFANHQR
jgi:hypothetical protein